MVHVSDASCGPPAHQGFRRVLGETVPQFTHRISKVAERMNSPAFSGGDGRGLPGLATELHERCRWVIDNKGQRYPK